VSTTQWTRSHQQRPHEYFFETDTDPKTDPTRQFVFETQTDAAVLFSIFDRFGADLVPNRAQHQTVTSRYQPLPVVTRYFFKKISAVTRICQQNQNVENYVDNRYQLLFKGVSWRSWIRGIELFLPTC